MKVLMFGWEFPPHNSGGLGVACQGLSRALSENHTEVLFVLPRKIKTEENFRFIFANNVFMDVATLNVNLYPYVTGQSYKHSLKEFEEGMYGGSLFEEVMRYAKKARQIALKENFDVIHAHDWLSFPAGIAAKKVSGKPLVVHVHATEFDRTGNGAVNENVYKVEKLGMEEADKVITVSELTKKLVIDKYGIDPAKVTVVHNGIEVNDYPYKSEDDLGLTNLKKSGYKIVLFLGRITLQKGPDYFVYAAKKVLKYAPKTMFVVVGSGDMENKIIKLAAAEGIASNFIFVGFLRGVELSRVYHSADAYVMPSVSEPFGITALESVLHGAPVIMSKQSGAGEVMLHALKSDFWDTDEMADKILSVISYPSLKKEMLVNCQKEVNMQTWDKAAKKCINVYTDVA